MYNSKSTVMFLGMKKQNFQDSEMFKIDTYCEGDVDSFFIAANNPLVSDFQKIKPTAMISIEVSWSKSRDGWKHRLLSVSPGV